MIILFIILFYFSDIEVKMEKYLNLAKVKRREFSLKGCNESFSKGVKSGVIKVMGKEDMVRLAIKPDGNCQFRAVATLLSGADDNDNHKVLRKLACEEFKNEPVESLRRTGFFSHSKSDCHTEKVCEGTKKQEYRDKVSHFSVQTFSDFYF